MNFVLIVLLVFSWCLKPISSQNDSKCGSVKKDVVHLMLNGYETVRGEWPWHVALYLRIGQQSTYACGGTLVTKLHVISAVHCVQDEYETLLPITNIYVKLGTHKLSAKHRTIQHRTIKSVFTVDKSSGLKLRNDIAILELSTEVEFSSYIQPACVSLTKDLTGRLGTAIGWGFDENYKVSDVLKSVQLPVVDFYTCLKSDRDVFGPMLDEGVLCAGYTNGTTVCNGDSGGGLFFKESGTWYLGGIVSFIKARGKSSNLCHTQSYGAFTRIHTYLAWIESVTKLTLPVNEDRCSCCERKCDTDTVDQNTADISGFSSVARSDNRSEIDTNTYCTNPKPLLESDAKLRRDLVAKATDK